MAEVLPSRGVNRWYEVKRPGGAAPMLLFAERYFDCEAEALDYWDRRAAELGAARVNRPLPSHEDPLVWAVCMDPQ